MRKLIVSSFVSLDGVIDRPWEWIGPYFDRQNKQDAFEKLKDVDLFLLSRPTYERFASTWPHVKGDAYIDKLNNLSKIVASRTLQSASWNATVVNHNIGDVIANIKKQPGKNILKYGFGELDDTLLKRNLVDEIQFLIIPVVVGAGRRTFDSIDQQSLKLNLLAVKRFDNGVISARYKPEMF